MSIGKLPGFTAENAVSKTIAHYRAASVFDSRSGDRAYIRQAARDPCLNLTLAYMDAPAGSFEEEAFLAAYYKAGCNLRR